MTSSLPSNSQERGSQYWRRNIRLLLGLLAVWATVSFGCGILLHHYLDNYTMPGTEYPLGFWFAQQGSILAFIAIVFYYAHAMGKLDREFGMEEK